MEELTPFLRTYSDLINGKVEDGGRLDPAVRGRLRAGNVVIRHGTDSRVLQYHLWDRAQPGIFDKKHFKYELQHDPVGRYTGTATTNFALQFYMNKVRLIHEREAVIRRVRTDLSRMTSAGFVLEENKQAIFLIRRFEANDLETLQKEIDTYLFALVNEVHPTFYKIMDAFGMPSQKRSDVQLSRVESGRAFITPDLPDPG